MEKVEVLQRLRKYVEDEKYIKGNYCYNDDEVCYCSVGFLMKELGVSDEQLIALGHLRIEVVDQYESFDNFFKVFPKSELEELQWTNDRSNREELLKVIDFMIDKAVPTT